MSNSPLHHSRPSPSLNSSYMLLNRKQSGTGRIKPVRTKNAIYCTNLHVVEHFGPQLPVLVSESLVNTPGAIKNASVGLNPDCGWGWYVYRKKLLVWPVVPTSEKFPPTVVSRDLVLPSSDVALTANHVVVFIAPENTTPSCVAVSPEGDVRFWQVVGQHSPWVDVNAHLGGEEVCVVRYIPPLGCLAVTTTASMILISPTIVKGQPQVTTKRVAAPQGWLNGLSRRMTSIIFGSHPNHSMELRVVKVLTKKKSRSSWHVYLLVGLTLQSWLLSEDKHELLYECELFPIVNEIFTPLCRTLLESEVVIYDIMHSESGLMTLITTPSNCACAIVELNCDWKVPPVDGTKLVTLTKEDTHAFGDMSDRTGMLHFLLLPTTALIYNSHVILAVPFSGCDYEDYDKIDIPGGLVSGGCMYKNTPLFFSVAYGFVSVTPIDMACMELLSMSHVADSPVSTPKAIARKEPQVVPSSNYVTSVKTAFIHYIRKNMAQYRNVVEKEFSISENSLNDSPLATTLVKVSLDIINDLPVKDPRWNESNDTSKLKTVTSLHVETQLTEKQQAHDMFLFFVSDLPLNEPLGHVQRGNGPIRVMHLLLEHNEKIVATQVLRDLQKSSQYGKLITNAIEKACRRLEVLPTANLAPSDVFFRYVSIVDEGLRALSELCEEQAVEFSQLSYFENILINTNHVFIEVIKAVVYKRESRTLEVPKDPYVPWLSDSKKGGVLYYVTQQATMTYECLRDHEIELSDASKLEEQLFLLYDSILYNLKGIVTEEYFKELRSTYISCFMERKEYEGVLKMAEKYKDFSILIEVCYLAYEHKVYGYMEKFGNEGFCEQLFSWLFKKCKYLELINLKVPPEYEDDFTQYISNHPHISWLHLVMKKNYYGAGKALTDYGLEYKANANKKARILSLSKLISKIENGYNENQDEVERQLKIINAQKSIPSHIFEKHGFSDDDVRQFTIPELIDLITGTENDEYDEYLFKQALDLLKLTKKTELPLKNKLCLLIWSRAAMCDQWENINTSSPAEILYDFLIFRLLELVVLKEEKPDELIPPVEKLLASEEIKELSGNPSFTFLLRYGYDFICGNTNFNASASPDKQS